MPIFLRNILYGTRKAYLTRLYQVKRFAGTLTGNNTNFIPLTEETLTGRILIYLNTVKETQQHCEYSQAGQNVVNILEKPGMDTFKKCDTNEIIFAIKSLNNPEYIHSKYEFIKFLKLLDNDCCKRLSNLTVNDTFKLLRAYMTLIPNRIIEYKYYNLAIKKLYEMSDFMAKNELVELIFYIGLLKKSSTAKEMLTKCLKNLNDSVIHNLTKEELCIICNSTFKTSTKIRNREFLKMVVTYLNDNLYLLKDPALFITLIKTIRHNRVQTEDILETISCTIFFNKTYEHYSFTAMCHILALYSDFLYYDENILKLLATRCVEQLKESKYSKYGYNEEQPRAKDINRMLWALCNLNYSLESNDIKEVVVPKIMERIEAGEFKTEPGVLIEIVLYLWMMNYKAYELIPFTLTKEIVEAVRDEKSLSKQRLNLLLYCIRIEDNTLYQQLNLQPEKTNNYNMHFQLEKRPTLQKTFKFLKANKSNNGIDKFEMKCQVPFINVVGITGYRKIYKAINIEVLDEYTCLKNTDSVPTGPMQLKLRLLEQGDEGLVVVEANELENLSDNELQSLLDDEIALVC